MKVTELMSKPVIVAKENDTLEKVVNIFVDKRIGGMPVVNEEGKIVGIITESDFATKEQGIPFSRFDAPKLFGQWLTEEGIEKAYEAARTVTVKEIMSSPPVTLTEDSTLEDVEETMLHEEIHHIPIVRDGVPVGMITRFDLLKLIVQCMRDHGSAE